MANYTLNPGERFALICGMLSGLKLGSTSSRDKVNVVLKPIGVGGSGKIGLGADDIEYVEGTSTYSIPIYTHDVDVDYAGFTMRLQFDSSKVRVNSITSANIGDLDYVYINNGDGWCYARRLAPKPTMYKGSRIVCYVNVTVLIPLEENDSVEFSFVYDGLGNDETTNLLAWLYVEEIQDYHWYYITPTINPSFKILGTVKANKGVIDQTESSITEVGSYIGLQNAYLQKTLDVQPALLGIAFNGAKKDEFAYNSVDFDIVLNATDVLTYGGLDSIIARIDANTGYPDKWDVKLFGPYIYKDNEGNNTDFVYWHVSCHLFMATMLKTQLGQDTSGAVRFLVNLPSIDESFRWDIPCMNCYLGVSDYNEWLRKLQGIIDGNISPDNSQSSNTAPDGAFSPSGAYFSKVPNKDGAIVYNMPGSGGGWGIGDGGYIGGGGGGAGGIGVSGTISSGSNQTIWIGGPGGVWIPVELKPGDNKVDVWFPLVGDEDSYEDIVIEVIAPGYIYIPGGFTFTIFNDPTIPLPFPQRMYLDRIKFGDVLGIELETQPDPSEPVAIDGLLDTLNYRDFTSSDRVITTTDFKDVLESLKFDDDVDVELVPIITEYLDYLEGIQFADFISIDGLAPPIDLDGLLSKLGLSDFISLDFSPLVQKTSKSSESQITEEVMVLDKKTVSIRDKLIINDVNFDDYILIEKDGV